MGIHYLPLTTAGGLFLAGVLIYPALFLLLRRLWANTALGQRIRQKYAFSDREVADISNKIVSAFQAVMAGVSGIVIVHACLNDVLREKNPMSVIYGWFGIPYFVYDTFCMFYVYRLEQKGKSLVGTFFNFVWRNPVIVTHHIIMAPIGFTLILFYRDEVKCGDFFVGILYMMEVSTPFVSLRFILSKMKLKRSLLYTINGLFMLLTFPVFRIASVLWATYLYTSQNSQSYLTGMLEVPILWLGLLGASLAPQIYWFVLMARGLVQILRKQPVKEE